MWRQQKFDNSTKLVWNYKTFDIHWNALLWTQWNYIETFFEEVSKITEQRF